MFHAHALSSPSPPLPPLPSPSPPLPPLPSPSPPLPLPSTPTPLPPHCICICMWLFADIPTPDMPRSDDVTVFHGETAILECVLGTVELGPGDDVGWNRDSGDLPLDRIDFTCENGRVLILRDAVAATIPFSPGDSNTYTCVNFLNFIFLTVFRKPAPSPLTLPSRLLFSPHPPPHICVLQVSPALNYASLPPLWPWLERMSYSNASSVVSPYLHWCGRGRGRW